MNHVRAGLFGLFILVSFVYFFLINTPYALALYVLNDVMSKEDQQITGVDQLNANQRTALEDWLNKNFVLKTEEQKQEEKVVFLSVNGQNGQQLRLSDGSLYEVAPRDRNEASSWITPFPIKISKSEDADYPYKLTNTLTSSSIKAKQLEPPTNN